MEFIKSNMNKGLAVEYVGKHLKVKPIDTLTAGNAINDIEMLDAGSGMTILVGSETDRSTILSYLSNTNEIVMIDNPEKLGEYLSEL
jgi:hydroxymethylpyrimidine pyrophosphatase-like HAD family hydrolase